MIVSNSIIDTAPCAGMWRGLPVAIKTILFQGGGQSAKAKRIVAETAIACALSHLEYRRIFSSSLRQKATIDLCQGD